MDLAAVLAGSKDNLADKRAQRLGRFPAPIRIVERLCEPDDVLAVDIGDVRVDVGNNGGSLGKTVGNFHSLQLKLVHPGLHERLVQAFLDGRHDAGNRAFDLLKCPSVCLGLHSPVTVEAIHLLRVGAHGFGDSFR
jgi:hypothetical protein